MKVQASKVRGQEKDKSEWVLGCVVILLWLPFKDKVRTRVAIQLAILSGFVCFVPDCVLNLIDNFFQLTDTLGDFWSSLILIHVPQTFNKNNSEPSIMQFEPIEDKHIKILDVTLRDGEQTQGVSFTPAEKTHIAKALLSELKIDRIEIASARISDGEKLAVQAITQWAQEHDYGRQVEVLGFVDHDKSVDWIKSAGGLVINLLTKGSEKHCKGQLRKTLSEHLKEIDATIKYARQQDVLVNVYLEDWSNGYKDSPEYVYEMMRGLEGMEIQHIMLPDTLGVMAPNEVYNSFRDMKERFPWANLDFHPHNDYGLATANVLFAVYAGVESVHCTINCLGERAGNASLAEVVVALKDKAKVHLALDESKIYTLSKLVENFSGKWVSSNTPITGADVFTQTSGIHADGDKKGDLYHNPIFPERFGRNRSYALGKMSGKASLAQNLKTLGLNLSEENFKKVLDRVVELGDSKELITMADLPFIITDVLESVDFQRFNLKNCTIVSTTDLQAIATIKVEMLGQTIDASGCGNGGYDAFMTAIKSILKDRDIECPQLVDYQIRIPQGGKTSALTEATIIWKSNGNSFKTIGVDSDQVMAAVNATQKMLNLVLLEKEKLVDQNAA